MTKRIFITGNAGSGKTTLSKLISKKLNIPFYSLDSIVWQPYWKITPNSERKHLISNLISKNEWIIEGVSRDVLYSADIIIFLDFSKYFCYWRLMKRNWKYLFKSRPELPKNCPEILIISKLIKIVWNFDKLVKPNILDYIMDKASNKEIYHIQRAEDIIECINKLK